MEMLDSVLGTVDIHFLFGITLILAVICLFYYSSAKKQVGAMQKIELSLKHSEQMNHLLALILNEQRRANVLLSEMAGIEMPYIPMDNINMNSPVGAAMNSGVALNGQGYSHHSNPNPNAGYATSRTSTANESAELNSQTKLYVGNIDYSATEAELGAHFERFGQVEFVNIPVNRYTGRARGFGFVTFVSKESAERAIGLNGSEFKGRQIQVNFAKERDLAL